MSALTSGATPDAAPTVTIGANFTGSNSTLAGIFPPNSDGAVGPDRFVEIVNGVYRVYDLMGTVLQQSSLDEFWLAVGLTDTGGFDPRVVHDPDSGRWFAAAMTFANASQNPATFLLAVSKTSDPTDGWQAVQFGQTFDFTRLGVNKDGIYLIGQDGTAGSDIVVVPKADLLGATPTADGATVFLDPPFGMSGVEAQPAVAPGLSGIEPLLSVGPDTLQISSLASPVSTPTFNAVAKVAIPEGLQSVAGAIQKGSALPIPT